MARKKPEAENEPRDKEEAAARALEDESYLRSLAFSLGEPQRGERAQAASVLHEVAMVRPKALEPFAGDLIDALERPETHTRWEVLGALEELARVNARLLDKAVDPATHSLHDAESGVARVAAARLLAAYGATTEKRAERVWPLLDGALRAYHGDPEYPALVEAVATLAEGQASDQVRAAAAERFALEVSDPNRLVARNAKRIVARAPKKRRR